MRRLASDELIKHALDLGVKPPQVWNSETIQKLLVSLGQHRGAFYKTHRTELQQLEQDARDAGRPKSVAELLHEQEQKSRENPPKDEPAKLDPSQRIRKVGE